MSRDHKPLIIDQICRWEQTILWGPPCFEFHDSFSPPLWLRTSDRGALIASVPVWPKLGMYTLDEEYREHRCPLSLFLFFRLSSFFPFFTRPFSFFYLFHPRLTTSLVCLLAVTIVVVSPPLLLFLQWLFILDHTRVYKHKYVRVHARYTHARYAYVYTLDHI